MKVLRITEHSKRRSILHGSGKSELFCISNSYDCTAMSIFFAAAFALFLSQETHSANILFFNGRGEGSHYLAAAGVAEELATQGHKITFILGESYMYRSHHPLHSKLFDFVSFNFSEEEYQVQWKSMSDVVFEGRNLLFENELLWRGIDMEVRFCENVFQPGLLKKLEYKKFDLVVYDPAWPCAAGLGQFLGVKKVLLCPTALIPGHLRVAGNPVNPATTAEAGLGLPVKMNFLQRVQNVIMVLFGITLGSKFAVVPYKHIFERFNIKPFISILRDSDLFIVASDPLVDKTFATMPGVVVAAGLTAAPPQDLHEDLERFMQSSGEHGVILFTLGGYVTHLPEKFVRIFKEAFAKLTQKVIWQWKSEAPPVNMPENVKTMSWLPQNDLLGHNKTRLLIYQGGNNGLYEAVYHGVPLLVMPLLIDQLDNAENVVAKGIGRKIVVQDLTSEEVFAAISQILSNQTYQNKVNHLSAIFRDQPLPPRKRVAFWIDHVLKHGSDHLRSPNHDLNFIQLNLIDVFSFLVFCLVIFLTAIFYAIKLVIRFLGMLIFGKKQKYD